MANAFLEQGLLLLQQEDWAGAIDSLRWAKDAEPGRASIFLTLIDAYERAADRESEPDLIQQAWNVCRDLRDRGLPMSAAESAGFRETFVRVRDKLIAARATGWTPPPPKEEMHRG